MDLICYKFVPAIQGILSCKVTWAQTDSVSFNKGQQSLTCQTLPLREYECTHV